MAVHLETEHEAPVSTLVGGIVEDARKLIVDQFTLFRVELKHDLQKLQSAIIPLVIGVAVMPAAIFMLGMGGAHLLSALAPALPLWASYLIIACVIGGVGVGLVLWGKSLLTTVKPMDTALKGLEENVTWKTKN